MSTKINSTFQLHSFKNKLSTKKVLVNGNWLITTMVKYYANGKEVKEFLPVTLHLVGFDGGKISIDEGQKINLESFHLDFTPDFQEYKCQEDGSILITGKFPKLGVYRVIIEGV